MTQIYVVEAVVDIVILIGKHGCKQYPLHLLLLSNDDGTYHADLSLQNILL